MKLSANGKRNHPEIIEGYILVCVAAVILVTDATKEAEPIRKTPRQFHPSADTGAKGILIIRRARTAPGLAVDKGRDLAPELEGNVSVFCRRRTG